jgi:hypothetical protein
MSSAPTTPIANSPVKKTKRVSLPEKYHKFIQFGYYMMSQMPDTETFTKDEFINNLKMFATVEEQQTFIQGFFDNQKSIKSSIRKTIQDRNKANKPKKVRAPRKTKKTEPKVEPTTQEAANSDNQADLISNLTDELTEEPMIDKINAAIEIAEDMTAKKKPREKKAGEKKQRVVKKKTENEPTTMNSP